MDLFLLSNNAIIGIILSVLYAFTHLIFTTLCGNSLLFNFTIYKCELFLQSSVFTLNQYTTVSLNKCLYADFIS